MKFASQEVEMVGLFTDDRHATARDSAEANSWKYRRAGGFWNSSSYTEHRLTKKIVVATPVDQLTPGAFIVKRADKNFPRLLY
jgi:hypothetical protein